MTREPLAGSVSSRRSPVPYRRWPVVLAVALLSLSTWAAPASAGGNGDIDARIDAVLDGRRVDGRSFGAWLADLDASGCLQAAAVPAVDGLADLADLWHGWRAGKVEHEAWRPFRSRLSRLSPDGRDLVVAWLSDPALARRRWLCEDGLPPGWTRLAPDAYVVEAVHWFDGAVSSRARALHEGPDAERQRAVLELLEQRDALEQRFLSTFPDDDAHLPAWARLSERLDLMWDALVDPWHAGFSARAQLDSPAASTARPFVVGPFFGQVPDPWDVAAVAKRAAAWKRESRALHERIEDRGGRLSLLVAAMAGEDDPALLGVLRVRAERLDREIGNQVDQISWFEARVRARSAGTWVQERLLAGTARRTTLKRLAKSTTALKDQRAEIAVAIADATARGAHSPGPETPGQVAGPLASAGGPGPGRWTAGLPGAETAAGPPGVPGGALDSSGSPTGGDAGAPSAPAPGSGLAKRVYEGPLPPPGAGWSADLVRAVRTRHPALDETDARILLSLIQRAFPELVGAPTVEREVWDNLSSAAGLRLRGGESGLSDLWRPGRPTEDQPEVTFVVTLGF